MKIRPIQSEQDYGKALRRIEQIWEAALGSPQGNELEILVTLVEAYESKKYPIDLPSPIDAIKFRLEQQGQDYRALIGVIGQRTRVYEVMRGDRPLSLNMIRNLHRKFGIPAEVLIQQPRREKTTLRRHSVKAGRSGRGLRKSA